MFYDSYVIWSSQYGSGSILDDKRLREDNSIVITLDFEGKSSYCFLCWLVVVQYLLFLLESKIGIVAGFGEQWVKHR